MSPQLRQEDFPEYVKALHGHQPFEWQIDLLAQVTADRRWPDLIDLPTGAGKTSVIDIALFALALDAHPDTPARERWAPRRIALVVDRRIVVDQAAAHGRRFTHASGPIVEEVRNRLRGLSGGRGPALHHAVLRGAMVRDEQWAERPDVPALLTSTVDQVGSRLLFRGYGISTFSSSIHAGLLASDTLILLDEVHLSRPFAQTLHRLGEFASSTDRRWHVVELSATPDRPSSGITSFPRLPMTAATVSSPGLRQRLVASKPATLRSVQVPGSKDWRKGDRKFAEAIAAAASDALSAAHVSLLGVVVNRVDTARTVAELLRANKDLDVTLVTGRMRPCDRSSSFNEKVASWSGERSRDPGDRQQVVVATQCIEAGADLDLDGLITELASVDALRQRFGRVDRRGILSAASTPAHGVILSRGSVPADDDPIYGEALSITWDWLNQIASDGAVDFGIEHLPRPPADATRTGLDAPLLTAQQFASFAQTCPVPEPDHVAARWLHGHTDPDHEVTVVWRDDIDETVLQLAIDDQAVLQGLAERMQFCPPVSTEGLAIPLSSAKAWLSGTTPAPIADVSAPVVDELDSRSAGDPRICLRWSPSGEIAATPPRAIRPGDTVIVPSSYGGITASNWDPFGVETVADAASSEHRVVRQRAVARLTPGVWHADTLVTPADAAADLDRTPTEVVVDYLRSIQIDPSHVDEARVLDHLVNSPPRRLRVTSAPGATREYHPHGGEAPRTDNVWFLVTSLDPIPAADDDLIDAVSPTEIETDSEVDAPSFTATTTYLSDHLAGVGSVAAEMATNLGFDPEVVEDLRLAGELHDIGKADQRFQLWLCDGDPVEMSRHDQLLAKSTSTTANQRGARRAARERSGYPAGQRHELQSLALIRSAPDVLADAHDPDLVQYLVASHHGHCRPFPPVALDDAPVEVEYAHGGITMHASSDHGLAHLGSGVDQLFPRLGARYGWHRLAQFEATFRLADRWRSAQEQKGLVDHG